jgi:hypothetical protein
LAFVVFNCRNCGAGVGVQPDNLLTLCDRCGTIYPSKDLGDVPVHIVPSSDEGSVRRAVEQRMANDKQMRGVRITITQVSGRYVPLYIQRIRATGDWSGYLYKKSGKSRIKVKKNGNFSHEGDFPVFARHHAHEFGMAALGHILSDLSPVPFRDAEWASAALPVLSVDIDAEHADLVVKDDLVDHVGTRIKSENSLNAITAFEADIEIQDRFILLVPLWTAIYQYRGGSYRVAVCGSEKPTVLAAMEPVFMARRLWHFGMGMGGVVGTGVMGYLGILSLLFINSDDGGEIILLFVAGAMFCFWLAWRTGRMLSASVNVEQLGRSEEVLS